MRERGGRVGQFRATRQIAGARERRAVNARQGVFGRVGDNQAAGSGGLRRAVAALRDDRQQVRAFGQRAEVGFVTARRGLPQGNVAAGAIRPDDRARDGDAVAIVAAGIARDCRAGGRVCANAAAGSASSVPPVRSRARVSGARSTRGRAYSGE
ncbi:MAG TPA: hypothetical protein VFU78_16445 [Thermomicrobiales bacterium]|nr:hypothetical protein [Thermomicrobiales bacterium]